MKNFSNFDTYIHEGTPKFQNTESLIITVIILKRPGLLFEKSIPFMLYVTKALYLQKFIHSWFYQYGNTDEKYY